MEKPRVLSGEALVAKGITKIDASLPEVGLKDAIPNGSWLEQKQIQAALEARKYLIETERIEKCGTLSHAKWRDDLMLAEVTQKVGGHWQYLGHNVGKTLYLEPEETLFLMEVNCLLLKHNEVTVSLQKAYSLLLRSSTTMIQYKVYASLSRLGYKVFRHKDENIEKTSCIQKVNKIHELKNVDTPVSANNESENVDSTIVHAFIKSECVDSPMVTTNDCESVDSSIVNKVIQSENVDSPIVNIISDSKSGIIPVVDTVIKSEYLGTPKDNTINEPENESTAIESQANKVSENNEQEELKSNDTNGNIVVMSEGIDSAEIAENNAENSVAKENESPNIMEVDETAELKTADSKSEIIQIVPSEKIESEIKYDNKIDSMEICTENEEATSSGIIMMEEVDSNIYSESTTALEVTSMIPSDVPVNTDVSIVEVGDDTDKNDTTAAIIEVATDGAIDSGYQDIEDGTKCLDDLPKTEEPGDSKNFTSTEKFTHKNNNSKDSVYNYLSKIEKLTKRQLKPSDSKSIAKHFENIPDLSKESVVTVNVPEQQLIPKNIFVNNTNYLLNLQMIKKRPISSVSPEAASYTSSDEVNGANIRRIRSSSGTEFPHNPNFFPQARFSRYNHFRPYGFWRPQNSINFYQLMFFQTRIQYNQRPHPFFRSPYNLNPNYLNISNNTRKRIRTGRTAHFQGIKNLAVRLKQSLISGNTDMRNLETLHGLLHSYNLRYKSRLRLTEDFDVVNEEKILETIDLDDDEEIKSKKPRLEQDDGDKFDENLYRLKQLALRLRDLETKDKATASHRRAFSKAIKTFNKSYNADIYLDDDNYEIIDRRCITLDSSSESDCVVEEPQVRKGKGKKLRNPFNILKRRSERLKSLNNPSTSKDDNTCDIKAEAGRTETEEDNNNYSELILKTFNESWLPNETDFGRAEIVPKRCMNARLVFSSKEQYFYEFMKDQFQQYQNWLEAKVSFLRDLEATNIAFKNEQARILAESDLCNSGLKPLIDFEDSSDMPSVLERLRIVKNNKDIGTETSLTIDFDVYNRDVQNFRKRSPPKPHFRIICIDESSEFPSAAHVMALHSKYEDNVTIVFAVVGIGSVSYVQIKPIDLPIHVPSNDVV